MHGLACTPRFSRRLLSSFLFLGLCAETERHTVKKKFSLLWPVAGFVKRGTLRYAQFTWMHNTIPSLVNDATASSCTSAFIRPEFSFRCNSEMILYFRNCKLHVIKMKKSMEYVTSFGGAKSYVALERDEKLLSRCRWLDEDLFRLDGARRSRWGSMWLCECQSGIYLRKVMVAYGRNVLVAQYQIGPGRRGKVPKELSFRPPLPLKNFEFFLFFASAFSL